MMRHSTLHRAAAIVPAAGVGARMGGRTPKQFMSLASAPILLLTATRLGRHPAIGTVVVAVPEGYTERAERVLQPLRRHARITIVVGGCERQDSVRQALDAVGEEARIVVVHDAVRPFVTPRLITEVIAAADAHGAALCALPVKETVKRVIGGSVEATVDRANLWLVQTPQAFLTVLLQEAHDKARRDGFLGTDDSALVERLGHPVRVVPGLEANVKITTPWDLRRARQFAAQHGTERPRGIR
jgi:2-C-methyl-D-erythritol 4-phosphate cytidylyltransferase